jgi:hypothetical protein
MKHPLISRHGLRRTRLRTTCPHTALPEKPDREPHEKTGTTVVAAIREYLSDILGAFMPGVYFSIHLFVSSALFLAMISGSTWDKIMAFISTNASAAILGHAVPFLVFAFCLFSYIVGSVFCRKDIKEPDTASAIQTYRKTSVPERKGLAFDFENPVGNPFKLLSGLFMRISFRVDFPYAHLKRYLETRNYTHLAKHIPWDGRKEDVSQRSKTFINILKSRIQTYAPQEMPVIEKNEAHIRLMNSLWYAAKSIRNISIPVLAGITGFYIAAGRMAGETFLASLNNLPKSGFAFGLALFSALQLTIACYIRRSIKQYFHYMRVREILYILEIADTIDRYNDGIDMFAGLEPPPEKKEGN